LNLHHGDAVQIEESDYSYEKLLYWSDTAGLIHSEENTLPASFRVGNGDHEFPPWHWRTLEDYDGVIWLSDTLRDEIILSFTEVISSSIPPIVTDLFRTIDITRNLTLFYAEIMIHGRVVYILSDVPTPTLFLSISEIVIEGYE
jgi:hypothetical protein